jgi:hypothetical protein
VSRRTGHPLLHAAVPNTPLHSIKSHTVHFSSAIAARRELIADSPFTTPFTPAAAQNGSALTPFGLRCTPSPLRCHKSHGLSLFPTTVNSATAGVHRRSTGSDDPLAPLSLPRGVLVCCEPHRPFLLHRRRPEPPRRVLLSAALTGSPRVAVVRSPPPTSFDSKL